MKRRRDDGPRSLGRTNRGGRDESYSERDREQERQRDRGKYDVEAKGEAGELVKAEMEKPNFGSSGLLAKETNTVKGVQLKYNEPPEARKPLRNWRLYVFKGKEQLGHCPASPKQSELSGVDLIHIYKQSAYLIGRDTVVSDQPKQDLRSHRFLGHRHPNSASFMLEAARSHTISPDLGEERVRRRHDLGQVRDVCNERRPSIPDGSGHSSLT